MQDKSKSSRRDHSRRAVPPNESSRKNNPADENTLKNIMQRFKEKMEDKNLQIKELTALNISLQLEVIEGMKELKGSCRTQFYVNNFYFYK